VRVVAALVVAATAVACGADDPEGESPDSSEVPAGEAATADASVDHADGAALVQRYVELLLDGEVEEALALRCATEEPSDDEVEAVRTHVDLTIFGVGPVERVDVAPGPELDDGISGEEELWTASIVAAVPHDPFLVEVSYAADGCIERTGTELGQELVASLDAPLRAGAGTDASPAELLDTPLIRRLESQGNEYARFAPGDEGGIAEHHEDGVEDALYLGLAGFGEWGMTVDVIRYESPEQALEAAHRSIRGVVPDAVDVLANDRVPGALGVRTRSAIAGTIQPPDQAPWRDFWWVVCGDVRITATALTSTLPADTAVVHLEDAMAAAGGCEGPPSDLGDAAEPVG
jgi:hypothetical protein